MGQPKVAKVTMISDKDPFCIVQILWDCKDSDPSEIPSEFYRILVSPGIYFPSGILVDGVVAAYNGSPNQYLQTFSSEYTGTSNNALVLPPEGPLNMTSTIVYFSSSRTNNPDPADGGQAIPSTTSEDGTVDFEYLNTQKAK